MTKARFCCQFSTRPKGFLLTALKPTALISFNRKHHHLIYSLEDLSPGEYAIAMVHDENSNLKLDTNLVGAPVEGYAASGVNKRFSAPKVFIFKILA
jgi:uncharacterized protein (DUF2141 family)